MRKEPPKFFTRLIRYMFQRLDMEDVEGDLAEDFQMNLEKTGALRAKLSYVFGTLVLIKTYLRRRHSTSRSRYMKTNFLFYFKYGIRSILKHKFYHALSMISLTMGFTCFALIYLFIVNHHQKDSFLENKDSIVRLSTQTLAKEGTSLDIAMPPVLDSEFPEIEAFARFGRQPVDVNKPGDDNVFEEFNIRADPALLDIFQMELVLGRNVTVGSKDMLVSENKAIKYWGSVKDAIGQQLVLTTYGREKVYDVVGVLKDLPVNSSFSIDMVSPISFNEKRLSLNSMASTSYPVFFKVREGTDLNDLALRIPENLKKHTEKKSLLTAKYVFRNIDEIKSNPKISTSFITAVDGDALFIFQVVGLVVLILAMANYINTSSALVLKRIQEAGIRRVMGASRKSLIFQQLVESLIIGLICIAMSALLITAALNSIEAFVGIDLVFKPEFKLIVFLSGILILIFTMTLASLYPALLLGSFKFSDFIKGKLINSPKSRWIRASLLVVQFSIATFLIVGSFTFLKQLDFINESHNKEKMRNVLVLKGKLGDKADVVRKEISGIAAVQRMSLSSMVPGPDARATIGLGTMDFEGMFHVYVIDEHFLGILGLQVKEGSDFYKDERNRSNNILVNESLVDITKDGSPLMREYKLYGKDMMKVIGIVTDFPVSSLKDQVGPAAYFQASSDEYLGRSLNMVVLELNSIDMRETMAQIEAVWNQVLPEQTFEAEFMDDRIESLYTEEMKAGQLFGVLTVIAILIACMGIFSLLTYMIQVRTKEIGIRKVLGANFRTIARLLTKQVWGLLLVAVLLSFPLSYYFLEDWLQSFAYRTDISVDLYLTTSLSFIGIVLITIIWQVFRATSVNPSEVLRNE